MLVRDRMTRHPLMVESTMPIAAARQYMQENHIRHLPIVGNGKRLLGLVTRATLTMAMPPRLPSLNLLDLNAALSKITVSEVMVTDVITIDEQATLEQAARRMLDRKIGCLLVVEEGIVIGIITKSDLLAATMELLGARRPGVRLTALIPDEYGSLAKVVSAISAAGGGIMASVTYPSEVDKLRWAVVMKIQGLEREQLLKSVEALEGVEVVEAREGG